MEKEEEPLIKIGEYIELRKRTNTDLLYVIKELKKCIEDYKEYDKKQKEILKDCNTKIGIQNARIKNQKKAITDLLAMINNGSREKINEANIIAYLDKLYEDSMVEAEKLKKELNNVKHEYGNCRGIFKQATGISYENWINNAKLKKELRDNLMK